MTTAVQLDLAYGYARRGEGTKVSLEQHRERIGQFAAEHNLVLGNVFTDTSLCPALQRPGLRALLCVAFELEPLTLVVPSPWHLAQDDDELARIMRRLTATNCSVLIIKRPKAQPAAEGRTVVRRRLHVDTAQARLRTEHHAGRLARDRGDARQTS